MSDTEEQDLFDDDEFREYSELLHRTYVAAAFLRDDDVAGASLHRGFRSRSMDRLGTRAGASSSHAEPEVAYFADVHDDDSSFVDQDTREMLEMARAKIDGNDSFPGRKWMDNPESPERDKTGGASARTEDAPHITWADASTSTNVSDDTSTWFADV